MTLDLHITLRGFRIARRMTTRDLADALGVDATKITQIERGAIDPESDPDLLRRWKGILKIEDDQEVCEKPVQDILLAFIGHVPVSLFSEISKVFEKRYPGALCLDGRHPTSQKLGATFCIIPAEENSHESIRNN